MTSGAVREEAALGGGTRGGALRGFGPGDDLPEDPVTRSETTRREVGR